MPQDWVFFLLLAHGCLSLAAAVGVFFLARWWPWRLIAWVGIVLWFNITFMSGILIAAAKAGVNL